MYVIDTSVFMADFRPSEVAHHEAFTLLRRIAYERRTIYAPTILLVEISASVARNTGDQALAQQWVTVLKQMPHIIIVNVDLGLGDLAAQMAAQHRIRSCDAIYVALAQLRQAVLITLDQEQCQRVPPGIIARTPAEELGILQKNNQ